MIRRLRIGSLIIGLLLTACVVAGAYVVLHFNVGGIRYLPPKPSTLSSLESNLISPFTAQQESKVIGADSSRQAKIREVARHQTRQRDLQNIITAKKVISGASALPSGLSAQAAASLEPARKTLKPIGYVQKANGLVEAIVSEGNGVQVVYVGDTFEEKYTVAQISSEGVEVVGSSASPTFSPSASIIAANSTPGIQMGVEGSASSSKPLSFGATLPSPKREAESKKVAGLVEQTREQIDEQKVQISARQAASRKVALATTNPVLPKPIGYVEMSAGNRFAVVPDGESVRFVQPEDSLSGRRGIEKASTSVEIASAPKPTAPEQTATNFNRSNAQPVPPAQDSTPTQASRTDSNGIVGSQQVTPVIPFKKNVINDRPLVASRTLGFVREADGKVQAIVDEGKGVRLVQVGDRLPGTLLAGGDSAKSTEGTLAPIAPSAPPPVTMASAILNKGAPPALSPGGRQLFPPGPVKAGEPLRGKDSALGGSPEDWEPLEKPPPKLEGPVGDDISTPEKPRQDDVIAASMGLEAEVEGSSKRDEAVLGSLGYLNPQGSRASPVMLASEPEAQPRGSPAPYSATVLRSFGYGNWNYGRASPLAASLEVTARANHSQNTAVLKSIGYLDWQDGRALAVVDDGDDGVRLVHKGELLDDNRFRVVKVYPEAVEIAELPISPPGLMGNPTFQPHAEKGVGVETPWADSLEKPLGSLATAQLAHREGQPSRKKAGSGNVPKGSSLAALGFALQGQSIPCFDFKTLLTAPSVSPGPWSLSALNLYFPAATSPTFRMVASVNCAGTLAY